MRQDARNELANHFVGLLVGVSIYQSISPLSAIYFFGRFLAKKKAMPTGWVWCWLSGGDYADCVGDVNLVKVMLTVSEPIIKLLSRANQKSKRNAIFLGIQIVKFVEALHAVSHFVTMPSFLDCYIFGVSLGNQM